MTFGNNYTMAGGRRLVRTMSAKQNLVYPVVSPVQDERVIVYDVKHIRIPHLPRESPEIFELILCLHVTLFTSLQFLHMYRTVWWLPQSFNNAGINFHMIDVKIIAFIFAVLFRRLPYLMLKSLLPGFTHRLLQFLLIIHMTSWVLVITYYFWKERKSPTQIFYLYMPLFLHFYVNGISIRCFWEMEELDNPESLPYHICMNEAPNIREQVEFLRIQFNCRLQKILCTSTVVAYYSAFLPWAYVQNYVYYDMYWVCQHLVLCWLLIFSLLVSRAFCPDFSDGFHKVACHLGSWTRLRPNHIPSQSWCTDYLFPPGSIVKHQRELYKADGILCVASEPGNTMHQKFQFLFSGSSFSRLLIGFHLALVFLCFLILARTFEWYQLISIGTILTTSFYTYIRLARDYLTMAKIYEAEKIIWTHGT